MTQKKIILVTGATGRQGGSVAKTLLQTDQYTVRVLTRNPLSPAAIALQNAGAELVKGDLRNPESLKNALSGCYGVFGVTNFWEHFEGEFEQGKNLIDAVYNSDIQHFVFSSLPDYNALSGGKYPTPHCDIKARLEEYAKSLGLPATFIQVPFYYENFISFLQQSEEGYFYFGFPQGDTKLSTYDVADTGPAVMAFFEHPDAYIGRTVVIVGEDRTCNEYAAIMTKVLGVDVRYQYIPHGIYAALGFPGAEEAANMFEVQRLYVTNRQIALTESYKINPAMQPFEQWLQNNKEKFSLVNQAKLELV